MVQDDTLQNDRNARLRGFIIGDLIAESGNILTSELIDRLAKQIVQSVSDVIDNKQE
jgi:hypothetical protein